MTNDGRTIAHYGTGELLAAIERGLAELGRTVDEVTVDDLGPVDEFHIGGRTATVDLIGRMTIGADDHVLDVGCGIGGTARLLASTTGCRVTGIDLVPEFVEVGDTLDRWTGLDGRIDLEVGSALAMPFPDDAFDAATQLHVGMNIADKTGLFTEVHRVLRLGGRFGVYDIMRTGEGELDYPVPWATDAEGSALAETAEYRSALETAGFRIDEIDDRGEFARGFFDTMRARTAGGGGPPPLGLHLIFGRAAPEKLANMLAAFGSGWISPVLIVATAG